MSSPPIVNPDVPYTGKIPDNLNPGEMVRIQGITLPNADRFNINLQTGTTGDIALHISARLNQGYVARNSYQNGAWEDEQGDGTLPIGPGQQFEVIILADPRHYKIAINGQHFCEFPHRVPINKVTHLIINGDLKITLISWEGNIPSAPPAGADVASSQASTVHSSGPQDGPPPPQFNPQQQQGGYGPPPSGYGPPPSGYGPGPQGPYGRPGYGPPPAPGHQVPMPMPSTVPVPNPAYSAPSYAMPPLPPSNLPPPHSPYPHPPSSGMPFPNHPPGPGMVFPPHHDPPPYSSHYNPPPPGMPPLHPNPTYPTQPYSGYPSDPPPYSPALSYPGVPPQPQYGGGFNTSQPIMYGDDHKKSSKMKTALKYGLPIAGAGVGAYVLAQALHSSSSSSSSSSSYSSDSD